jgi:uncharacterized protein (TIGR03435 family)
MLVEAVFWFHPLVWWMESQLVKERERACDEDVLLLCHHPQAYAESILKVCELCIESPLTCVSGITGADLKRRIVQIMTAPIARKLGLGAKLLLLSAASLAIAAPILLGQMKAAQRIMLAAADAAPTPFRTVAHNMLALEETPSTSPIAEADAQPPSTADATAPRNGAKPFKFDVVSIRPADPVPQGRRRLISFEFTDDGLVATNDTLLMMLMFQHQPDLQMDMSRIVGGPDWARTLQWDLHAKVADSDIAEWSKLAHDSSAPAQARHRAAVEAMLAEQFKLKTHVETKEGTVYALVVAKGGPKLKPSTSDAPPRMVMGQGGLGHLTVERTTIGAMVPLFAQELGRPVIDKTGITGKYDLTLEWTPAQAAPGAPSADAGQAIPPSDPSAPSLFTALQEQLGLKLEPQKGPIETLVIDHAEKPSFDGAELPNPPTPTLTPVSFAQASPASPPRSRLQQITLSAAVDGPSRNPSPFPGTTASPMPVYPSEAKAAGIQGIVELNANVTSTGTVASIVDVSGPQALRQSAIDAVMQWQFKPLDNGKSIEGVTNIKVLYQLPYQLPGMPPVAGPVPPPEEAAAGVKQVGGDVTIPLPVYEVQPDYTDLARADKVEGTVIVGLVVDEHGQAQRVHVMRGLGDGLDEKAIEAVKRYHFKPATENSKPVAVFLYFNVGFKLN